MTSKRPEARRQAKAAADAAQYARRIPAGLNQTQRAFNPSVISYVGHPARWR